MNTFLSIANNTNFTLYLFIVFIKKDISFQGINPIKRRKMHNSRRCVTCNNNVQRASYAKHLRSKKHLQNIKQDEIKTPEWLFKEGQTPTKKKTKKHTILNL